MELDTDKIDQAVLALLALGRHDGYRAWKAFDWEVMGQLHVKGCITDPVGKAKSVFFTEELLDGSPTGVLSVENLGKYPWNRRKRAENPRVGASIPSLATKNPLFFLCLRI